MKTLAVIIPTHNRRNKIISIIGSLIKQELKSILVKLIIVVDEELNDTACLLKNEFEGIHIVKGNGNWWYTKSMNEGFKHATRFNPDDVLTLNDDVVLAADYFEKLELLIYSLDEMTIVNSIS